MKHNCSEVCMKQDRPEVHVKRQRYMINRRSEVNKLPCHR